MGRRLESSDNRPIFPPESSDTPPRIVRNGQAKHPNRLIVKELKVIEAHQSAEALAKAEARVTDQALKEILEKLAV